MEKWVDRKNFNFFSCVFGEWENVRMKNSFIWLKKKNEKIENGVCINLFLCPIILKNLIIYKKKYVYKIN